MKGVSDQEGVSGQEGMTDCNAMSLSGFLSVLDVKWLREIM